jgi:hypothetical protein
MHWRTCVRLLSRALSVAPIDSGVWRITSKMHDQFREEIGWLDLARSVANIYRSLSAEEQGHTGILAGNYGEVGALNLYGPAMGLPHAMGLTNSFWYREYDPRLPQTVILAGFETSMRAENPLRLALWPGKIRIPLVSKTRSRDLDVR